MFKTNSDIFILTSLPERRARLTVIDFNGFLGRPKKHGMSIDTLKQKG
jgi:hypothetical protein